jgi:broad specificity phosphatase PhoE
MLLHCLRHGASVANLAHRFNPEDDPLHESTIAAMRAGQPLDLAFDRIYVSPLPRAVQTAEHIGLADWTLEPRITERRLGVFAGLTAAECEAQHAQAFEDFGRLQAEPAIPAGESRGAHLARVMSWLKDVAGASALNVLAVTHGGVIDFLFRMGSGRSLHGGAEVFGGDNLGLSTFDVAWPQVRLIAFSTPLVAARP